jgi:hypothetical protein
MKAKDGYLEIPSLKGKVSEAEWQARVDLAACYRLGAGVKIGGAFNWLHRLKLSCYAQLAAMACNSPMVKVSERVLEETWKNYQASTRRCFGDLEWPALIRKLDRADPTCKN